MGQAGAWTDEEVAAMAATPKALAEAKKLAAAGAVEGIERSADGRTWKAGCRGTRGTYQITVHRDPRSSVTNSMCNCPSSQFPCKHALALMLAVNADAALHEAVTGPGPGSDAEALLRAVFQQPDDDTPRLVFADYLDDHGDGERAAFIRLQCRIARLTPRDRGKRELRKQEAAAIARFAHFSGTLDTRMPTQPRYERGFLHLTLWTWSWVTELPPELDRLLREGWVASLEVTGQGQLMPAAVEAAGLAGALDFRPVTVAENALLALATATAAGKTRATGVKLRRGDQRLYDRFLAAAAPDGPAVSAGRGGGTRRTYRSVTATVMRTLVRAGRLDGVLHLWLDGPIGDDGAAALAESPTASSLRSLELRGTRIGPDGGAALAASEYLAGVSAVQLFGHAMDDGLPALCAGGGFPGLVEFLAAGGKIGDEAAQAVGRATHFRQLKDVIWDATELTPPGAAAILASEHLPALTEVTFNGNPFTPESWLPLAVEAADRPALKLVLPGLEVHRRTTRDGLELAVTRTGTWGHRLTTEMIEGLVRCTAARRISALTLTDIGLTPDHLRGLAKLLDPSRVRSLGFAGCRLGNAGATALASAFAAFRPTQLSLTTDSVRRAGAEALAASPLLQGVKDLNLSGNALAPAGVAAFTPRGTGLTTFHVRDTGLTAADRRRLKKQLPGLTG
jgi:uncharacterized protein (TIGR02996 family)